MLMRAAATVLSVLISAAIVMGAEPKVGALGDLSRLEFSGNHRYTASQLQEGLWQDLDCVVAGRSDGPLDQWLRTLERQLMCGYRSAGHFHAQTKARHDQQRDVVIVDIEERPQFTSGEVEVVGAKTIAADWLREQPTVWRVQRKQQRTGDPPLSPYLPPTPLEHKRPLWTKGEAADCAREYWRNQSHSFRSMFRSRGYFDPVFEVSARTNADQTATLMIAIDQEGPRATLDKYDIIGLSQNSAEDVIRYLGLPLGSPLNSDVVTQIEKKLWDSARFLSYRVEVVPSPAGSESASTTLKITLREYEDAPLITEELLAEEKAALQFVHWLGTMNEWKEDLEIVAELPLVDDDGNPIPAPPAGSQVVSVRLVVSPTDKGLFLSVQLREQPDRQLLSMAAHLTPERTVIDAIPQRLRYECSGFKAHLIPEVTWKSIRSKGEESQKLLFGVGYGTFKDRSVAPFIIRASLPPALVLKEYHQLELPMTFGANQASVDADGLMLTFDRLTGVLNELTLDNPIAKLKVMCRPGIYKTAVAEHERQMNGAERITPGDVPVSSFIGFVIRCLPESNLIEDVSGKQLAKLGQRLLKHEVFRPFDELVSQWNAYVARPGGIYIPYEVPTGLVRARSSWTAWIMPVAEAQLPPSKWAKTVAREYVLAESMKNYRMTDSMLDVMSGRETGPLAALVTSAAFQYCDPRMQRVLAKGGLQKMDLQYLKADCDLFLNDKWSLGRFLISATAALRDADDDEIEALCALLSLEDEDRVEIKDMLKSWSAEKAAKPEAILRASIEEAWEPWIKDAIAEMLEKLSE